MRAILLLSATCMLFFGCSASTVQVIDDSTGMPVEGAEVKMVDQVGGEKAVGRTDRMGHLLVIPADESHSLTVSKPGYRPFSQPYRKLAEVARDFGIEIRLLPIGEMPPGVPE